MTSWRGVGHLGATALALALLSWPGALISAGDLSGASSGEIAVSLRTVGSTALDRSPAAALPAGRGWRNPRQEAHPFLDEHFLPRVHKELKRTKAADLSFDRFRRDLGRATEHAVTGYLEEITLVPMRDRLEKILERVSERRSRRSSFTEPVLVAPLPRTEPHERSNAPAVNRVGRVRGDAPAADRARRERGDFDVDLGYSSGAPELKLEYRVRNLDFDVDLRSGAPELKMEYKVRNLDLDVGFVGGGPELSLKIGPGGRLLRLDVRGDGRMGLVFRPLRRSTVKARLDPGNGSYYTSFVHRF